jgi:tRNA dimethylallyltransferase
MSRKRLIVISGPTASGKSALAVEKALQLDTEIISADSRQIYRHIPILTAVPSMEERQGVKHHLLEELELEEYFSASLFEERALTLLEDIFTRRDDAIVCGGSMMYVDALCNGIDDIPTVPDHIRTPWR